MSPHDHLEYFRPEPKINSKYTITYDDGRDPMHSSPSGLWWRMVDSHTSTITQNGANLRSVTRRLNYTQQPQNNIRCPDGLIEALWKVLVYHDHNLFPATDDGSKRRYNAFKIRMYAHFQYKAKKHKQLLRTGYELNPWLLNMLDIATNRAGERIIKQYSQLINPNMKSLCMADVAGLLLHDNTTKKVPIFIEVILAGGIKLLYLAPSMSIINRINPSIPQWFRDWADNQSSEIMVPIIYNFDTTGLTECSIRLDTFGTLKQAYAIFQSIPVPSSANNKVMQIASSVDGWTVIGADQDPLRLFEYNSQGQLLSQSQRLALNAIAKANVDHARAKLAMAELDKVRTSINPNSETNRINRTIAQEKANLLQMERLVTKRKDTRAQDTFETTQLFDEQKMSYNEERAFRERNAEERKRKTFAREISKLAPDTSIQSWAYGKEQEDMGALGLAGKVMSGTIGQVSALLELSRQPEIRYGFNSIYNAGMNPTAGLISDDYMYGGVMGRVDKTRLANNEWGTMMQHQVNRGVGQVMNSGQMAEVIGNGLLMWVSGAMSAAPAIAWEAVKKVGDIMTTDMADFIRDVPIKRVAHNITYDEDTAWSEGAWIMRTTLFIDEYVQQIKTLKHNTKQFIDTLKLVQN